MRAGLLGCALAALGPLLGPAAAAAQAEAPADAEPPAPTAPAALSGEVVSEATGAPLAGAVVALRHARYGAITDSAGRFLIQEAVAGADTLDVDYVGFRHAELPIDLRSGHTTHVVLLLSPSVIRLAELTVEVARPRSGPERAADRRRRRGPGHFLDREAIEGLDPRYTSDVLREVPGLLVGPNQFGRAEVTVSRSASSCHPAVFLDGTYVRGMVPDDVPVTDVEAIEVYLGAAGLPVAFSGFGAPRECGALAIWTREGELRP